MTVLEGGRGCGRHEVAIRIDGGSIVKHGMDELTKLWPLSVLALLAALGLTHLVLRMCRRVRQSSA